MFAFNIDLGKLFYIFEVLDGNRFFIGIHVWVFIIRLEIEKVEFIIGIYNLFKVDSVYQFGNLDYSYITDMILAIMQKSSLQIKGKAVYKLVFFWHKYNFFLEVSFKNKKVFISIYHLQYILSLFKYYEVRVVIVLNTWLPELT